MDDIRKQAKASRASKLARFGGHTSGHKHVNAERAGYATGGAVPGYAAGGEIGGEPAPRNLSKPGRKMAKGGKDKKGTTINIMVAGGGKPGGPPPDMPMPPPQAGPPPGPPSGPPPMPMGGPGPGGPPMRKAGGRIIMRAKGGRVKKADGGSTISEDSKKEAKRLREEVSYPGTIAKGLATGAGAGTYLGNNWRNPAGAALKVLGAAVAGAAGGQVIEDVKKDIKNTSEASRIEKGKAKPGEEDRKAGGRVKGKR